jgi:hypothetical protein
MPLDLSSNENILGQSSINSAGKLQDSVYHNNNARPLFSDDDDDDSSAEVEALLISHGGGSGDDVDNDDDDDDAVGCVDKDKATQTLMCACLFLSFSFNLSNDLTVYF